MSHLCFVLSPRVTGSDPGRFLKAVACNGSIPGRCVGRGSSLDLFVCLFAHKVDVSHFSLLLYLVSSRILDPFFFALALQVSQGANRLVGR